MLVSVWLLVLSSADSLVSNGRQSKQTGGLVLIKDILLPSALELFTNVQL